MWRTSREQQGEGTGEGPLQARGAGAAPQGSFSTRKPGAGRAGGAVPAAAGARSEHRVAPATERFLDTLLSPVCHFSKPDLGAQTDNEFLTAHDPTLTRSLSGGKGFYLLGSFTVPSARSSRPRALQKPPGPFWSPERILLPLPC